MILHSNFFTQGEIGPVSVINPDGASDLILVCEHASNGMPSNFNNLGLNDEVLVSHAAWDPGALAVAKILSHDLDATLIYQNYSRLIYDCNRPPDAAGAMPLKSEIYDIPGNLNLSEAERFARTSALYVPFHDEISELIQERRLAGRNVVVATVHSFTPIYHGQQREVEIGILHDTDSRIADEMIANAVGHEWRVERNEPYGPADGVTHTLRLHALPLGLRNVMIEVRNDLVADEAGERKVANFLYELLNKSLAA